MNQVDWVPAVSVLAAGLLIGGLVLWRVVLRGAPAPPSSAAAAAPLALRDLAGKYEALIGQLRELDGIAAKRTPDQVREERHALEHEAARVLREIDRQAQPGPVSKKKKGQPEPVAALPPVPAPVPASSALRGFLWGVGSVGAFGVLFFFVSQAAKQRAPGESLTGNTPAGGEAQAQGDDAELAQARALVERKPQDLDARLGLARLLLVRQDMMAVFTETQAALQLSPGNPRALSYQALVRLAMGQAPKAESMLKEALQKDPQLLDAYLHLMLVYVRSGRPAEAEKVLAEAKRRFPERAGTLQDLLTEMRSQGSEEAQAADASDPHSNVPVGGGAPGGSAAPAPAGAGAKKVSGLLELDASLQGQAFSGSIVFVTLREGGFGAGPPLAARRIPAGTFPMPFEIGAADSMTGEPLPDDLLIEARIDSDGDPITRPPSDPYGRADRVPAGSKDVKLVMKRRPQP
jgi:cytochrome c-type biogenesis protein CcmH